MNVMQGILEGLAPAARVVIGGEPQTGKTAFLKQIADLHRDEPHVYVLTDKPEEWADRPHVQPVIEITELRRLLLETPKGTRVTIFADNWPRTTVVAEEIRRVRDERPTRIYLAHEGRNTHSWAAALSAANLVLWLEVVPSQIEGRHGTTVFTIKGNSAAPSFKKLHVLRFDPATGAYSDAEAPA